MWISHGYVTGKMTAIYRRWSFTGNFKNTSRYSDRFSTIDVFTRRLCQRINAAELERIKQKKNLTLSRFVYGTPQRDPTQLKTGCLVASCARITAFQTDAQRSRQNVVAQKFASLYIVPTTDKSDNENTTISISTQRQIPYLQTRRS